MPKGATQEQRKGWCFPANATERCTGSIFSETVKCLVPSYSSGVLLFERDDDRKPLPPAEQQGQGRFPREKGGGLQSRPDDRRRSDDRSRRLH